MCASVYALLNMDVTVCVYVCVWGFWSLYSINSTGLSAPRELHTLNTNTEGVSTRFRYACVALYICIHVHPTVGGWGGSKCCAVWQSVETGTSMCAFECDSARHEGIMTVWDSACVCVFYGHTLRLINIDSELSLLAGVAGGFDGADWTETKGGEKSVWTFVPWWHIFPFSGAFKRVLEQGTDDQSQSSSMWPQ